MTANGPTLNPLVHSFTTPPRQPDIGPNACTQDKENWPRIATQQKQWTLADYSCNGATAAHAALYLQLAVRNKDLGPNTKKLIISLGALQPDQQFKAAIQTLNLPPTYTPHTYKSLKTGSPPSHQTPNSSPPPTNHSPHPATTSAPPHPKPTSQSPYKSHSATKPKKYSTTT